MALPRRSCWTEIMTDERQIDEVMARYVRAADFRDPAAMAALFTEDAIVEISYRGRDGLEPLGSLKGAEAIGQAVAGILPPHPARGWSHHTSLNHIIDVDGDTAGVDLHFVNYDVRGDEAPAAGWPEGTYGTQGTITPFESGYVRSELHRADGVWKITKFAIMHDLPFVLPGN